MLTIPLSRIPAQTLNVILAGQYCTLSVYWRQERLYLDLSVGAIAICQGAICQNCADVLQSRSQDFAGTLHFFDQEGDRPPRWDGLHTGSSGRWILLYLEDGEEMPLKLRH
jgi:hypothetical protein